MITPAVILNSIVLWSVPHRKFSIFILPEDQLPVYHMNRICQVSHSLIMLQLTWSMGLKSFRGQVMIYTTQRDYNHSTMVQAICKYNWTLKAHSHWGTVWPAICQWFSWRLLWQICPSGHCLAPLSITVFFHCWIAFCYTKCKILQCKYSHFAQISCYTLEHIIQ